MFQDKNVYVEDWGEALVGKSAPVLCVADLSKGDVTMCPGVPPHVSPGQVSHYFWFIQFVTISIILVITIRDAQALSCTGFSNYLSKRACIYLIQALLKIKWV